MKHIRKYPIYWFLAACIALIHSCAIPNLSTSELSQNLPQSYSGQLSDSNNSALLSRTVFFKDALLTALIDTALKNNQELNIMLQEIEVAKNEVMARQGAYLPFVEVGGGAGVEKTPRYTSKGANDASTDIAPGRATPEPLPDLLVLANVSWEIDIWKKLRNARQAASLRYLSTAEGRNFMQTRLVAEIANAYYDLVALDNQLEILQQTIRIQTNALEIVKQEKQAARVTELAVKKFEAEVLKNQSHQFEIKQRIIEKENEINFLVGRFPQTVQRNSVNFNQLNPDTLYFGVPVQLIENRPDVKQAELQLEAAKIDVKVARAEFYPSLRLSARTGLQAFNPVFLAKAPESILLSILGDMAGPVINRKAIKADYLSANAKQLQAVINYERALLNACTEVSNNMALISNLQQSFDLRSRQVDALTQSVDIAGVLFRSARADYMEVLLTQRDALEARFELIETKKMQMNAMINTYRALGGGWR